MNRSSQPHPTLEGFKLVTLQLAPNLETPDWHATGIHNPPPGYRGFARMEGEMVTIGVEPIDAKAVKKDKNDFSDKSDAELMTLIARKNLQYRPDMKRAELLAILKAS